MSTAPDFTSSKLTKANQVVLDLFDLGLEAPQALYDIISAERKIAFAKWLVQSEPEKPVVKKGHDLINFMSRSTATNSL